MVHTKKKNLKRKNKTYFGSWICNLSSAQQGWFISSRSAPSDWMHLFISITWSLHYGNFKVPRLFTCGLQASQASLPRREPGGNWVALHCLALEVMQPYFCQVLLIQASSSKASPGWRRGGKRLHLLSGSEEVLQNQVGWKIWLLWFFNAV